MKASSIIQSSYRQILAYILISFGFSWLFWLPGVLDYFNIIIIESNILEILKIIASFGPFVGAVSLSYIYGKWTATYSLLKKGWQLNFNKLWIVITFALFPLINGIALVVDLILEQIPDLYAIYPDQIKQLLDPILQEPFLAVVILPYLFFFILVTGGPLGEEYGWRGYIQARLQLKWSPIVTSALMAIIWSVWHLPLFFIEGTTQANLLFVAFFINTFALSIIFTWVHNKTNGSVFTALVLHTMANITTGLIPVIFTQYGAILYIIVMYITCISIIALNYHQWFKRPIKKRKLDA